jgi:hypothetical protein
MQKKRKMKRKAVLKNAPSKTNNPSGKKRDNNPPKTATKKGGNK